MAISLIQQGNIFLSEHGQGWWLSATAWVVLAISIRIVVWVLKNWENPNDSTTVGGVGLFIFLFSLVVIIMDVVLILELIRRLFLPCIIISSSLGSISLLRSTHSSIRNLMITKTNKATHSVTLGIVLLFTMIVLFSLITSTYQYLHDHESFNYLHFLT